MADDAHLKNEPSFTRGENQFLAADLRGQMVLVTPEEDSRLIISEDQLSSLVKGGSNQALQWSLALFGVAIGLAQNLIAVAAAISDQVPMGLGDAAMALICVAAAAAGTAKFFEARNTSTSCEDIANKIRSGKRHELSA